MSLLSYFSFYNCHVLRWTLTVAQLSFWVSDNPCYTFPTLYFDVFVDTFFLVRPQHRPLRNVLHCVLQVYS